MKTNIKNFKQVIMLVAVLLMVAACEKGVSSLNLDESPLNFEEVVENAMIDIIPDEVDNIAENVYYVDEQQILAAGSGGVVKDAEAMSYNN